MEQSSYCTASTRHYTDNVQEQTEDILVQRVTVHTAHLQLSGDFALYKCSNVLNNNNNNNSYCVQNRCNYYY